MKIQLAYFCFFTKGESLDTENLEAPQLLGEETKGPVAGVVELLQTVQQPLEAGAPREDCENSGECAVSVPVSCVDQVCFG